LRPRLGEKGYDVRPTELRLSHAEARRNNRTFFSRPGSPKLSAAA
jgi:hypothetical protein